MLCWVAWSAIAWVEQSAVWGKQDRLEEMEKKEPKHVPAIPHRFPWSSEGALITHQVEGVEPSRAHAHDVGAHFAEEAALF